ncbi:putative ribonuclease H-like domain-containing protein [Tanacetum coccineum]
MVPRTVLTRSGPISFNTAKPVNTVQPRSAVNNAGPMKNVINNAYLTARRPFNKITASNNSNFNMKENKGKALLRLIMLGWRPKHKVLDHVSRNNGASMSFKRFDYVDAQGRSKFIEEINGVFVAFGGNSKGRKITRKDFKLTDKSQVLLKVPRKDNMYSVDLKNVVPQGGLTCLFTKATPDESNLWHRRLGHVNFKTMNKLVKGNLVRGYFTNSKAFRVFNSRTRIVEENLHVQLSENKPNIAGSGPNWLFDIDALTNSMNYKPVVAGNQSNGNAGEEEKKDVEDPGNEDSEVTSTIEPRVNQEKDANVNNTNSIKTISPTINALGIVLRGGCDNIVYGCVEDPNMPELEEIGRFSDAKDDISGADMNNLDTYFQVSPVPTTRIHKDHPIEQIIGDLNSAPQTRRMTRNLEEHRFLSTTLEQRRNHKDIQNCLFACFLSQEEPKKVVQALKDPSWIEAMQEELLQFKLQEVWTLVELPNGKRAIGTKWVFRNKKDERGIVIKNKARLKEDGIFISQDKYVNEILNKFGFSDVKTARTPMETQKALLKDADGEDVDEHLYRSMIGSLMYLTSLRPHIMFADSPFDLVAYTDSDYAGASLDRKSTTGGCQFLGCRLISWQCKKQTVVANSTTEAEYIAASNCFG